ncbi:alpha-L-fucosidase [Amycolatopsis sp. CA-230715]|uniref:alpha-L-fucosidase n=1 Tax=Amycolatopsis sp. CA-230715 TaxID=2745196 RepID=UPI001C03160A|nr:alpha-L-fucosidase [Amycolatopsis sp. CA-230715]QWF81909.1 hypothetical protein HUW46_05344 [Amycolatopsis sp. CA-230715]
MTRRSRFTALAVALLCVVLGTAPAVAAPRAALTGVPAALPLSGNPAVAAWQRLQFGMMLHWGLYSQLGGYFDGKQQTIGYPEQIKAWMHISDADYLDVAKGFSAPKFDPAAICGLAKSAGAKYIVITSKHHDGFAMWDTKTTGYNVKRATPFGADPLRALSTACHRAGIGFGVYFSIIDWTKMTPEPNENLNPVPESMMPFMQAQLKELMTGYGKIDEVWFDMGAPTAAQSAALAATVHRYQPAAMVNSRVWNNKGDFEVGGDNKVPDTPYASPWQSAESVFPQCWGYCAWPSADRSPGALAAQVRAKAVHLLNMAANGGQYLLNVGPKGDGSIDPFDASVLRGVGDWTRRNPGAALGARPTRFPAQPWGKITADDSNLYLGVTNWTGGEIRVPTLASEVVSVTAGQPLRYRRDGADLVVTLPATPPDPVLPVIRVHTAGTPRTVPAATVTSHNGRWRIGADRLAPGRSTMGDIRQAGYFASTGFLPSLVSARVDADGVDPRTTYRITLGDRRFDVSGRDLRTGSFLVFPKQVTEFSIERAHPDYTGQPLGLTVHGVDIS